MYIRKVTAKKLHMASFFRKGRKEHERSSTHTKIRKYLAGLDGCFFWKEHGGQYGTAGIPDIIICYHGQFIALEAKVGRNKPTKLQTATIEQIRKAGGTAAVVYSIEDVKAVLGKGENANGKH